MNILALDLSLTSTGWADATGSGVLVPPEGSDRGMRRLTWIRGAVLARAKPSWVPDSPDLVVLEGYAYARANQAHQIGELGGVIRLALYDHGVPYVEIAPTSLKAFATGSGNAGKPEVLSAAIQLLGYRGHKFDEADALFLLAMARAHYTGVGATNAKQRAALAKITWPAAVAS